MKQKEVKIIGLKVNNQMGILHSCELKFDPNNVLIAVKGEVGSGKTTLQKSLSLGTKGSDTLKDDKKLYGDIDQEVQLLDGDVNIFVGCKTGKKGIDYVIYTKDIEGKIVKNPVVDGVKLTPSEYLKSLQTALTWRMDELTSENLTTQKNILLELYKPDLANIGVVFDKKNKNYSDSILGKIDEAINTRTLKDFKRKQVGGFANQLEPLGIDVNNQATLPKRIDISKLEAEKNKISYDIDNISTVKEQKLSALKNKADAVVNKINEENTAAVKLNEGIAVEFAKKQNQHTQNLYTKAGIETDLNTLVKEGCLKDDFLKEFLGLLNNNFKNDSPMSSPQHPLVEFNENGIITTSSKEWTGNENTLKLLIEREGYVIEYLQISNEPIGDTTEYEKQLDLIIQNLALAKTNNNRCDMVDSYVEWSEAHAEVMKLRNEYATMLSSISTGVDGLKINVDKDEESLDIYLTYNGAYDAKYFNNENLEDRKLSSYSGTQKPLICLLLQNYLLSKKPKAMRYLWIDNVPIDKKTKTLLNKMGEDLGLTIIVNITGDFVKDELETGEILLDGGEVFFK